MNIGKVINIIDKFTVKIKVNYIETYEKYGKSLNKQKIMMVHNTYDQLKVGDIVEYRQCAPISKKKKHVIINIRN